MKRKKELKLKIILLSISIFFLFGVSFKANAAAGIDCNTSADCNGLVCADAGYGIKTCVSPKANGSPCSTNGECSSSKCVDAGYGLKACQSATNNTATSDNNNSSATSTGNSGNEDTYQVPPSNYDPGNTGGAGNSNGSAQTNPNLDCSSGVCFPVNTSLPDPGGGMAQIISNVLYWILGIFGFLAIISFIISGTQYILSAGNERAVDNAKRNMTYSIIGVAVALSGVIIIYAINNILIGTNPAF
jgi:hypothetical protein